MISIKKNPKQHNEFKVTMTVTAGKILALKHALESYATPVAIDLLEELNRAIEQYGDSTLKD